MRIAIHTLGTRGDVQPYVALALGLKAAGHEVSLAAPSQLTALAVENGIDFAPLPGEFLDLLTTPEGKAALSKGGQGFGGGFRLLKHFRPLMLRLFDTEWAASESFAPELIVYHPKALAAPHIAQKLGCPAILASPLPGFTPTAAFPTPMLPFATLGPLNRISHGAMIGASGVLFGRTMAKWRVSALGLPARSGLSARRGVPTLYAYSPTVVPVPADWGPDVLVTGYWFLDDRTGWSPPPALAAFLAAGPPPVYLGFGSMPAVDPAGLTAMVVDALVQSGQRGVVATGWGGLAATSVPANVHVIEGAPHDKLFPLMSAVVHHGGAGTTAAGLRAGKPTVICPFFGDQPFWGRRIALLGAGPQPIPRSELGAERLAAAIREAVESPAPRTRAEAIGQAIRSEDGVGNAVRFIERVAGPAGG
jgi:sterol 3beta-glucosyltransferase